MSAPKLQTVYKSRAAAYLLIVVATLFFIISIRPGHDWGGDFALYIAHAKNIATGHQYTDTGFVYNPNEPFLSPRSYPPVFPLLLSPVYAAFGLNLYAMKVANILVFAIFLVVFYRYAERHLESGIARLVLLAMVAFSPWYWDAKDSILPDYAFLLFMYSTILIVDSRFKDGHGAWTVFSTAVVAGLLVYLSYGTRSVGMFLVPAMFLHDLVRYRKLQRATLLVAVVFAVFYLIQNAWLPTDASYIESIESVAEEVPDEIEHGNGNMAGDQRESVLGCGKLCLIVEELASRIPWKIYYYSQVMNSYWENGFSTIINKGVFFGVGILAVLGFISQISRRPSVGDYFVLTYIAVLLAVPFEQARYMLPLVPLYLLYAVSGVERLFVGMAAGSDASSRASVYVLAAFVSIVALSYVGKYSTYTSTEIMRGVENSASREMFEFVRTTPADSLFVFHKPRPLALFTGRRSVRYQWEPDVERHWRYLTGIGATHIIVPKNISVTEHTQHFIAMIVRYQDLLDTEFENEEFIVYRIKPEQNQGAAGVE